MTDASPSCLHRSSSPRRRYARWLPLVLGPLCLLANLTLAQEEKTTEPTPPAMEEISPGVYKIGKMRLDKAAGSLSFPTSINMDFGLVEYVLVTPQGSTHESTLVTDMQPSDIHFAMLLLGAKGAPPATTPASTPHSGQIEIEYLRSLLKPKGDAISLTVKWTEAGKEKTAQLEDWLINNESNEVMKRGPWLYTGSMLVGQTFMAQADGNIIAVITNPSCLINNPRSGSDNDKIWFSNRDILPAKGTPVELTITLLKPAAPASNTANPPSTAVLPNTPVLPVEPPPTPPPKVVVPKSSKTKSK